MGVCQSREGFILNQGIQWYRKKGWFLHILKANKWWWNGEEGENYKILKLKWIIGRLSEMLKSHIWLVDLSYPLCCCGVLSNREVEAMKKCHLLCSFAQDHGWATSEKCQSPAFAIDTCVLRLWNILARRFWLFLKWSKQYTYMISKLKPGLLKWKCRSRMNTWGSLYNFMFREVLSWRFLCLQYMRIYGWPL